MQKKEYNFSIGITATQEELNIEQDYQLMDILSELGIGEGQDLMNTPIRDLIGKLVKNDLLSKLLDVILQVADQQTSPDWKKLKNSELQEVITDFFTLNPLVVQLFKGLGSGLGMSIMNTTSLSSETNAKNTIPDSSTQPLKN